MAAKQKLNPWNCESKEIKYQIGEGCSIDQAAAQWHANLCGLGEIFDREQTKKALASLYKYNFKQSMRNIANTWRLFSLNDEAGLVICSWPKGKYKPAAQLTYSSETMTGFEYQAAVHMIQEGLVEEGLSIVKAIRGRYDGERRNPWNEIECGSNYARSMASYGLLLAFSGFKYDMTEELNGFDPIRFENGEFRCFWSLHSAWGKFEVKPGRVELRVLSGEILIKKLQLPFLRRLETVRTDGDSISCEEKEGIFIYNGGLKIQAGKSIILVY